MIFPPIQVIFLRGNESCLIRSDSESGVQAINSTVVESKLVLECIDLLKRANQSYRISVEWVKGHAGETGNEYADCLARAGNRQVNQLAEPAIPVPTTVIQSEIEEIIRTRWQTRWNSTEGRRICKHFFPIVDQKKCKRVAKLSRRELNLLFQACTGHGLFRGHIAKWKEIDPACQLCLEEDEKSDHLWSDCPALWRERQLRHHELTKAKTIELEVLRFFSTASVRNAMANNGESEQ